MSLLHSLIMEGLYCINDLTNYRYSYELKALMGESVDYDLTIYCQGLLHNKCNPKEMKQHVGVTRITDACMSKQDGMYCCLQLGLSNCMF